MSVSMPFGTMCNTKLLSSWKYLTICSIHGVDKSRLYYAKFAVPGEEPDYHRIQHFGKLPN